MLFMKKNNLILLGVVVLVIVVLVLINYAKSNGNHDEGVMKCIAENSRLFVLPTCSHCAAQKQLLGESIDYFNIVDCAINNEECSAEGIVAVPTWKINGEEYRGYKTIEELKQLTGCG